MNTSSWSAWLQRPLGVFGVFITFVYAVCGIAAAAPLSANQKWFLLIFVAVFSLLCVAVFVYLVVCHSPRLFAPGDFADENNFFRPLTPAEKSEKVSAEIAQLSEAIGREPVEPPDSTDTESHLDAHFKYIHNLHQFSREGEAWVVSAVAARLNATVVDRDVAIELPDGTTLQVDAFMQDGRDSHAVEVKLLLNPATQEPHLVRAAEKLIDAERQFDASIGYSEHRTIPVLAIASQGVPAKEVERLVQLLRDLAENAGSCLEVMQFSSAEIHPDSGS